MNPFGTLMATGAMLLLGSAALAQERGSRDGHRDTYRTASDRDARADRNARADWNRGERDARSARNDGRGDSSGKHWGPDARGDRGQWRYGDRPHYSSGGRGYWGPRYYSRSPYWRSYPSWFYSAPVYPLYISYADWEPPVYVERVVQREPVYVERIQPRREYSEPAYAQATPPRPVEPSRPVQPPARLERYTLSATELFEFDKAALRMPQPKLDEIADVMARNPQIDKVTISGFTDRIGTDAYNMKLSQKRADAVKAYLMRKGVATGRLVAIGKGEANPVVQCSEKNQAALIKCLEPNRRVEVQQITVERRQ